MIIFHNHAWFSTMPGTLAGYLLVSIAILLITQTTAEGETIENPPYSRTQWPHWLDVDGDCQDTRQEVLIRQSLVTAIFESEAKCRVLRGLWADPYTGYIFVKPGDLDIDHVIPLAYAHAAGGYLWEQAEKAMFANDQMNLFAVSRAANRRKGARGPSDFLPVTTFQNEYISLWKELSLLYHLNLESEDEIFLQTHRLKSE